MTILGSAVAAVALALAVPASGAQAADDDTPFCVSWDEFVNAVPGDSPSTGTHRNVVWDHFGVEPDLQLGSQGTKYEKDDYYRGHPFGHLCWGSGDADANLWYNKYVSPGPSSDIYFNLGLKCQHDGPGGHPDQCWT